MRKDISVIMVAILFCYSAVTFAQSNIDGSSTRSEEERIALGALVGYACNIVDARIGDYPVVIAFLDIPFLGSGVSYRIATEYFQSKSKTHLFPFEYKGVEYNGMSAQLWQNFSLLGTLKFRHSRSSSLGVGVSLEVISVKQVKPQWKGFRPPFTVDPYTDRVYYFSETTLDRFVAAGIHTMIGFEPIVHWQVAPVVNVQCRITFVGEQYGKKPLNVQMNFSLQIGMKYQFER